MKRIKFVDYQGHRVLLEDFSNINPGVEFQNSLDEAKQIIRSQPNKSVLALFDATGARFNKEMVTSLIEFVKGNTPFIKSAAVVGVEGLVNVALTAITKFGGRSFKNFKDRKSAIEWLISQ